MAESFKNGPRKPTSVSKSSKSVRAKRVQVKGSGAKPGAEGKASGPRWTFLSNHAHVLICLAQEPELRLRDVAERIGITERSVQNILAHLEEEGLVIRSREGRRNNYELVLDRPLRHPIEKHRNVGDLVDMILD